ncbi:unnamed protein product [Cyclocybe aegerita]|uniref:Rab-GAP TBC domain-containing protein n=1 Tax=Cyclocybe aegerita TaxID=1973307 RepID=A0A8S0X0N2_CYCAE|nr:unnamed protein product [Cyclocybe aegerita]
MGLEAAELARWTRFAAKGGIGKCTAINDCVAESADDLMFLKDDEITVLFQLPDMEGFYLGYCEGVVGRFSGADVMFHAKLKKPVMTKRSSVSASSTSASGPAKSPSPSGQPLSRRGSAQVGGRQRSLSVTRSGGQGGSGNGSRPQSRSQTPPASSPQPQPHLPPSGAGSGSTSTSPLPTTHSGSSTSPLPSQSSFSAATSSSTSIAITNTSAHSASSSSAGSSRTATATPPSRSPSYSTSSYGTSHATSNSAASSSAYSQSHASSMSYSSTVYSGDLYGYANANAHTHKQTASYSSFTSASASVSAAASPPATTTTFAANGNSNHSSNFSSNANTPSYNHNSHTPSYVTSAFSRDADPTTPSSTSSYPVSPPPTSPTSPTHGVSPLPLRASPLPRTSPIPTSHLNPSHYHPSQPHSFGSMPSSSLTSPTSPTFPAHSPGSSYPPSPVVTSPVSPSTSTGRAASSWASNSVGGRESVGTPLSLVFGGGQGHGSRFGSVEVVQEESGDEDVTTPSDTTANAIELPATTSSATTTSTTSTKRLGNIPPPLILRSASNSSSASGTNSTGEGTTSPLRITKRSPSSPPANSTNLSFATAGGHHMQHGGYGTRGLDRAPSVASVATMGTGGYYTAPNTASSAVTPTASASTGSGSGSGSGSSGASSSHTTTATQPPPTATSPPESALPSALDTSVSTMSDLAEAHPGRFSVWDVSATLKGLAHMSQISEASVYSEDSEARVSRVVEEEEEDERTESRGSMATESVHPSSSITNDTTFDSTPSGANVQTRIATTLHTKQVSIPDLQDYDHDHDRDQVGIGLSLLQDLVGGMNDWSDSEDGSEYDSPAPRARRVNGARASYAGSDEGTVEGLGYARSEDGHSAGLVRGASVGHGKMAPLGGTLVEKPEETEDTGKDLEKEGTSSNVKPNGQQPQSQAQSFLSPTTSPTGVVFPRHANPQSPSPTSPSSPFSPGPVPQPYAHGYEARERRPSLAPSSMSAASGVSAGSGGTWEGAGDIYDDYRYSRYSMMSKASLGLGDGSGTAGEDKPPMPERSSIDSYSRGPLQPRERADSNRSAASLKSDKERERLTQMSTSLPPARAFALSQLDETDSPIDPFRSNVLALKARGANVGNANVYPSARFVEVEVHEAEDQEREKESGDEKQDSGPGQRSTLRPDAGEKRARRSVLRSSVDSEASVYTQNSRLSMLEREVEGVLAQAKSLGGRSSRGSVGPGSGRVSADGSEDERASNGSNGSGARPPPLSLNLSASTLGPPAGLSPLLHTDWASPATATALATALPLSPSASALSTPIPGGGAGMASAMRMRLEGGRSPKPEDAEEKNANGNAKIDTSFGSSGLGSRIVVEDDEELPSRVGLGEGESRKEESSFITEGDSVSTVKHAGGADESSDTQDVLAGLDQQPAPSQQPPSHLRPNAAALLAARSANEPGRRSLFAPHPNAPKAPEGAYIPMDGPLVGSAGVGAAGSPTFRGGFAGPGGAPQLQPQWNGQPQQAQGYPHPQGPMQGHPQGHSGGPYYPPLGPGYRPGPPMRPSVINVIRMALSRPPPPHPPNPPLNALQNRPPGAQRPPPPGPTIYARTEIDLAASLGPVPILFSADPLPPVAPPVVPQTVAQVQEKAVGKVNMVPRSGLAAPPIIAPTVEEVRAPVRSSSVPVPAPATNSAAGPSNLNRSSSAAGPTTVLSSTPAAAPPPTVPSTMLPLAARPASLQSPQTRPSTADGPPGPSSITAPETTPTGSTPIPRAGFTPQAPGLRPRSRSFSSFRGGNKNGSEESREDPDSSRESIKRSLTSSSSSSSLGPATNSKTPAKSSPLRPSPLSLRSSTSNSNLKPAITSPLVPKPPSSPLATQNPIIPPSPSPTPSMAGSTSLTPPTARDSAISGPPSPAFSNSNMSLRGSQQLQPQHQLRQMGSRTTLGDPPSSATSSASDGSSMNPVLGRSTPMSRSTMDSASIYSGGRASPFGAQAPSRTASLQPQAPNRSRADSVTPNPHTSASSSSMDGVTTARRVVSPPPGSSSGSGGGVFRQTSLRSKLSLPNLRRNKSKQDDEARGPSVDIERERERLAMGRRSSATAENASNGKDKDLEVLQVQDMEFELVRPSFSQFQAARTSEDSNVLGREPSFDGRLDTATPGSSFLRPDSPAMSISSGGGTSRLSGHRSPTVESATGLWIPQPPAPPSSAGGSRSNTDAESNMDAHRQRELKWMSLMSSAPASSSRKSKKVRKLLMEGVPSSVRYLVWSYLTDGKARCVPGVYAQLCGRGRVGASSAIERDVERAVCFEQVERERAMEEDGAPGAGGARGYLSGTRGAVVTLLQAYLNMVPDVQYSKGLTLIVGQLLLLAPEEDAFWIFVSIMDTHVRAYFSATTTQMEVDAALFSRALEANDAPLARKLLVDMGILPGAICAPWFSTLFVGTLPPEYLNRVWDLFLYEGIPFLLRVALALMICCRRKLLDATSEEVVLQTLAQPPSAWLPATLDAFLSLAFSVKLKDDDIRKQRVKMEAQVKRQTQAPRPSNVGGAGISLPRT